MPFVPHLVAALVFPALSHPQQPVVRDSAGIQIVLNTQPILPAARAWRLDPKPTLEIGGPDQKTAGDTLYEFNLVMGIVRFADGRIAVGVQGASAIRFYDATGKFLKAAGRRGQGPGEFRQIMKVRMTRGDTLFVTDLGEVEYFTGRGEFVRQGASRSARAGNFIYPGAVFADGSYAGVDWNDRRPPPTGRAIRALPLLHVSADGSKIDSLGMTPAREGVFDGQSPFGREVVFASGRVLESDGQRLFSALPATYEIEELTRAGKVVRLIRRDAPRAPVTSAAKDAYRARVTSSPGEDGRPMPPAMQARREQMLAQAVFADHFPAFSALLADRAGNLWVQRFDYRMTFYRPGPVSTMTIAAPTTWDVFDTRGRWLCAVEMPERFTPLEIGADYVAGLARDRDEIEIVRVYRLAKP